MQLLKHVANAMQRAEGFVLERALVDFYFSPVQKRDDFRYANGPSYCISEALMMKVEKYLRYISLFVTLPLVGLPHNMLLI